MRLKCFIAAFAVLTAWLVPAAQAAPISYKLTGTMSGALNGVAFNDSTMTWTMTSDTTLVQPVGLGVTGVPVMDQSLDIAGLGAIQLAPQIFVVPSSETSELFFSDFNISEFLTIAAPQLSSYEGISSIGPIAVTFAFSSRLPTDVQGDLVFNTGTDMVFQAIVAGSTVPEPITLALFGAGLAGIGTQRRRRRVLA